MHYHLICDCFSIPCLPNVGTLSAENPLVFTLSALIKHCPWYHILPSILFTLLVLLASYEVMQRYWIPWSDMHVTFDFTLLLTVKIINWRWQKLLSKNVFKSQTRCLFKKKKIIHKLILTNRIKSFSVSTVWLGVWYSKGKEFRMDGIL